MPHVTTADLIDDVLFRAGEPTDGTSDFQNTTLDLINRNYQELINGASSFMPDLFEDWWWLYNESSLNLEKVISTGTVNVAINSASITFSTAPLNAAGSNVSVAGWHIQIGGTSSDVFKILTHTSGATAATIDANYTGATNATASYSLFKLDYSLIAGIQFVKTPMHASGRKEIGGMEPAALSRMYPLNTVSAGVPRAFAMVGPATARFSHKGSTSGLTRVDYAYKAQPTVLIDDPTSIPVIPLNYRHVLADCALALLMLNKDDSRAQTVAVLAKTGIAAMARENKRARILRAGPPPGSIIPRANQAGSDSVVRTESGNIVG